MYSNKSIKTSFIKDNDKRSSGIQTKIIKTAFIKDKCKRSSVKIRKINAVDALLV